MMSFVYRLGRLCLISSLLFSCAVDESAKREMQGENLKRSSSAQCSAADGLSVLLTADMYRALNAVLDFRRVRTANQLNEPELEVSKYHFHFVYAHSENRGLASPHFLLVSMGPLSDDPLSSSAHFSEGRRQAEYLVSAKTGEVLCWGFYPDTSWRSAVECPKFYVSAPPVLYNVPPK